jgi:two-component system, OmpR family, KDP operon response regulator KdpE
VAAFDGASLLVVEDDRSLAAVVSTALDARGYRVKVAPTGREALELASLEEPDLVLLDLGLPDIDGIEVCRELRRWYRHPILVLSADGAEDRKIGALDEGADDYVTKPFSMPELFARVRVALRHRAAMASVVDATVIEVGTLRIDTGGHTVTVDGEQVDLTPKEFALVTLLARNPSRVITHTTCFEHVWRESEHATNEALRVHIAQLRKKLGDGPGTPQIVTEPGVGYRLLMRDDEAP